MNAQITIAQDFGSSITKGIYRYTIDDLVSEGYKALCPIARRLNKDTYYSLLSKADSNTSLVAFDDTYWIVGVGAKEETHQIAASQSKIESAIAKSLAMVGGLITEMQSQGAKDIFVTLGALLPLDEAADFGEFEKSLQRLLYEFEFNGNPIQCMATHKVEVSPEGYGISRLSQGAGITSILVFGHRDFTYLHLEDGTIVEGKSKTLAGWGMHRLIKSVKYTFKDELKAARAIFGAGANLDNLDALKAIAPTPDDTNRLIPALKTSIDQLWMDLLYELKSTSLAEADQVIPTGGNAYYWRSQLKDMIGKKRLFTANSVFDELALRYPKRGEIPGMPSSLRYRIMDLYLFWLTLPGATKFNKGSVTND